MRTIWGRVKKLGTWEGRKGGWRMYGVRPEGGWGWGGGGGVCITLGGKPRCGKGGKKKVGSRGMERKGKSLYKQKAQGDMTRRWRVEPGILHAIQGKGIKVTSGKD